MNEILPRRTFLGLCAGLAAASAGRAQNRARSDAPAARAPAKVRRTFIGIQCSPFPWIDEGVDQVLDNLQSKGNVNAVWASTYDYGHGRPGRNSGTKLPDHGKYGDDAPFHGGAFFDYDRKYFPSTSLAEFRASDYGKFNVIEEVAPKAKRRGMDFFAWDYNNAFPSMSRSMPNLIQVAEIDMYGKRTNRPCFNHPDYQRHLLGRIDVYYGQYRSLIDGIAWGCEREGPFHNSIGGRFAHEGVSCFCEFCLEKARERGISAERARRGYAGFESLIRSATKNETVEDGYFVTLWRLLLEYPEILAWENLWTDSYHAVRAQLYGAAKALAPDKPFGFHIQQNASLNPFYRAEEDYARTSRYADFLKLALYNNAGGPRMAAYLDRLSETIFHDAKPEEFLPFYYGVMKYNEAPYAQLSTHGLSADYVARETRRAVAGVHGVTKIYPGIDVDVPTGEAEKHTHTEDVRKALQAAFAAGADGVILSREYAEMHLTNLQEAGTTLREILKEKA